MIDLSRSENYDTRDEWLDARRKGIGGSDAPAVLKQSPWASPWSVWAEKRGILNTRRNESQRLLIGTLLEPVIAELYKLETGCDVTSPGQFRIFQGEEIYQRATLDRVNEDEIPVELKTENYPHKWKDVPPLYYQIQAQHQMATIGADRLFFAVFFGPNFQFGVWELERNDRFIKAMNRVEADFWDGVINDTPPEIDGSEATREALQDWGSDKGQEVELPAYELLALDRQRCEAIKRFNEAEREAAAAENKIKALMGPAEIALLNGEQAYSWKGDKRGTRRFLRLLKEGK